MAGAILVAGNALRTPHEHRTQTKRRGFVVAGDEAHPITGFTDEWTDSNTSSFFRV